MSFEIKGKVALISGGASGIGLEIAKELLRNGLKGVALADINDNLGQLSLEEIQNEFGTSKAVYIQTDVTNMQSYEDAFKKTVEVFKNVDILVNSAGLYSDALWEKEIAVNINATVNGVLLGLETYIPKHKTGSEGVIVNIASTAGLRAVAMFPIYTCTKFAVVGMSKAFGDVAHFNRTKVRVLALCPGLTKTPLIAEMSTKFLGPPYKELCPPSRSTQKPENVALALVKIVQSAKTGTVWVAESGQGPYEYIMPPRESFAPK